MGSVMTKKTTSKVASGASVSTHEGGQRTSSGRALTRHPGTWLFIYLSADYLLRRKYSKVT